MLKIIVILSHALVGWALCGATIALGRSVTSMEITLIIHALAVPIIFGIISLIYFKFFNYTSALQTATIFTSFAFAMDYLVVATFIEKSYAMFQSFIGTWLPFGIIFLTTWLIGLRFKKLVPFT